jgi:hypothetical protein
VTIAASLYVSGTRRGAETELFLASLGLGSLDLKPPRFFVQTPRTRRGSFFTGSWSPLVAVHRTRAPWLLPSAFRPRVSEMSCDCSEASRTVPRTVYVSPASPFVRRIRPPRGDFASGALWGLLSSS